MIESVRVVTRTHEAAALLSEPRLRLMEQLAEPDSASGVARRLSLPRQQINYHLRELEKAGLVEFVEERKKGNCLERLVRATARSFIISPDALGALGQTPEEQRDRFSAGYLIHLAARLIGDLGLFCKKAKEAGKRVATLGIETEIRFASPEHRSAFAEELAETLARLTAKYHSPQGRTFRVIAGAYPATKGESNASRFQN